MSLCNVKGGGKGRGKRRELTGSRVGSGKAFCSRSALRDAAALFLLRLSIGPHSFCSSTGSVPTGKNDSF